MSLRITREIFKKGAEKTLYETTDPRYLLVKGMKDNEIEINNKIQETIKRINKVRKITFNVPKVYVTAKGNVLIERISTKYHFKITNSIDFYDSRYGSFKYVNMPETWKEHTLPEEYRLKYIEAIGEFLSILKYNNITCEEFEVILNENMNIFIFDFDQCYMSSRFEIPSIEERPLFYSITKEEIDLYETVLHNRYDETLQILNTF